MMDESLNDKFERLLALMEAQLEFSRLAQHEEQLRCARLREEDTSMLSHSEDRETVDKSMIGDLLTLTLASHPHRSVSFADLDNHSNADYKKYTSPIGPRYLKPRTDLYGNEQEDDPSVAGESNLSRSKPIATTFPKFNPKDVESFILEAEAWFRFNQVHEQGQMINHTGAQLEGNTQEWWTSKIHIDRACEGRLFHDWHYFTKHLVEQFNPHNTRMEAYNKLLTLNLTSNAPGATTRHVEQFRDLEGQVNLDDNDLIINLFQGSLTHSLQEKFEWKPPVKQWGWY
ncbi:related to retrotransposon protein [Ustilago bromivora]|uniref:Related to retrotransposon protein n=1 Tax=Ustilago bromivora TaxID=307758 RepID=A0A1K0G306_9BASI|nr:related to retrotransposon protein [Ustilago bromivora]